MRVAIIGSGYVGLVSGACFSDFGHVVTCVDKDLAKIGALNSGVIPIFEPGLTELVQNNMRNKRLFFTMDMAQAVSEADVVFIAVGTPSRRGDGHADLTFVYDAAREIAPALTGFTVVVTKSTVPVGTGDEVERVIRAARPDAEFEVVSNPEFLREGAAISDFKHPDRILIGTENELAREVMRELYKPLSLNQPPLMFTDRRTSELTKYAANAFLAMKVSFINEIADLCEVVGADVQDVARGIGFDKRIGAKFLNAGPGYGGSCFPKDTLALVKTATEAKSPLRIIEAVISSNDKRKTAMADKIIKAIGDDIRGKTVALLGLAFKPNTDDMRDAPSLTIAKVLHEAGVKLRVYDPESMKQAQSLMPHVAFCTDPYDCASGAAVLAIVTEWDSFRALDLDRIKALMVQPILVDMRNIYRAEDVRRRGFIYYGVGKA